MFINLFNGVLVMMVVISIVMFSGGDKSNGVYFGSVLMFVFKGMLVGGIYIVVLSCMVFVVVDFVILLILVDVMVGVVMIMGSM